MNKKSTSIQGALLCSRKALWGSQEGNGWTVVQRGWRFGSEREEWCLEKSCTDDGDGILFMIEYQETYPLRDFSDHAQSTVST